MKISHLTKRYGHAKTPAVQDVSIEIKTGEVYGFLGANGAGKSTTIRTVMDFIRPTSGHIELLGRDNRQFGPSLRKDIGYLPGDVVLPRNVSGRQLLGYLASLTGGVDPHYRDQLTERFEAQLDMPTEKLSKGNRQKIGLIQAFMHQPNVLILDEPTSGLDPLMQEQFYRVIETARDRGAIVFLSSHSFDEVERVCDRIGIIRQGALVYEGSIDEIRAARRPRWQVTLTKPADVAKLTGNKGLAIIQTHGNNVTIEPKMAIDEALAALSKVSIVSFTMQRRELEDEFMRFYQRQPGEAS